MLEDSDDGVVVGCERLSNAGNWLLMTRNGGGWGYETRRAQASEVVSGTERRNDVVFQ